MHGKIKRPDFLVGIPTIGTIAVDVKAKRVYADSIIIDAEEHRTLANLSREGRSLLTAHRVTGSGEAAPGSHRTWRADFPHHALRPLVHSTASACNSLYGRRSFGRNNGVRCLI